MGFDRNVVSSRHQPRAQAVPLSSTFPHPHLQSFTGHRQPTDTKSTPLSTLRTTTRSPNSPSSESHAAPTSNGTQPSASSFEAYVHALTPSEVVMLKYST
ncbi:hypothetical protein CVT26_013300 [Gymnopilus dilepis]|uniref:Uncharacterized protein n=1 Tax=Gymnopilus dilepis TaxID=231916 RepID=A0A409VUP3_9AGAR|nr:hypothetical protein CVT26_013300 [Gymnopilus dilepis]